MTFQPLTQRHASTNDLLLEGRHPKQRIIRIGTRYVLIAAVLCLGVVAVEYLWSLRSRIERMERAVLDVKNGNESNSQESRARTAIIIANRDSICFLQGTYSVERPRRPGRRIGIAGTGFVVGTGLMATNRHVVEPWRDDDFNEEKMSQGAEGRLHELRAFCPGESAAIPVSTHELRDDADVAVLRFDAKLLTDASPLLLASGNAVPGEPVIAIGYPMGISTMLATSSASASDPDNSATYDAVAEELAAASLIRPSVTFGYVGDVSGTNVIYDALTTYGSSGGPVFNMRGEVTAISTGFVGGFVGGNLGVSVEMLRSMLTPK